MNDPMDLLRAQGSLPASPAFARNREPILDALATVVAPGARVLEIGSGTSEHARWLAPRLQVDTWQITDQSDRQLHLRAWQDAFPVTPVAAPLVLDLLEDPTPPAPATWDVVLAVNVVHISPASCTAALMRLASAALKPTGHCVLYGPFFFADAEPAASNVAFDASLRSQDPQWGVRTLDFVERHAQAAGLQRVVTLAVPANNHVLVFARSDASTPEQGTP